MKQWSFWAEELSGLWRLIFLFWVPACTSCPTNVSGFHRLSFTHSSVLTFSFLHFKLQLLLKVLTEAGTRTLSAISCFWVSILLVLVFFSPSSLALKQHPLHLVLYHSAHRRPFNINDSMKCFMTGYQFLRIIRH